MTTVGIAMVRDEVDVVEGVMRHTAEEVDYLLVADNGSTDGTREILEKLADELPLLVVDDPDVAFEQSRKMSALAERAADELGAAWVVPFDADELWVARGDRIKVVLADLDADVARAELTDHGRTDIDDDDPDPFRSMVWRQRNPVALAKVAIRWQPGAIIHQGNHGVTLPDGGRQTLRPELEIRHFPIRSAAQMISKTRNGAAAYAATDMPWSEGQHWRSWGLILDRWGEAGITAAYDTYWHSKSPIDAGMVHDPAPYRRWEVA